VATYFDKREQREKTIPDCSKVGLTWNPETQRCEQMSNFNSLLMAANLLTKANPQPAENTGMGFLQNEGDYYDDWEYDYYWDDWGWSDYSTSGLPIFDYDYSGYGYDLPDYRSVTGSFDDPGIDWDSYWDSFFSGGDLFIDSPGNDFLQVPNSSVSNDPWLPDDFWDWLTGIVDDIPGTKPADPVLPGYCPQGTYHPIGDPYACVPFPPNDPTAAKQAAQQKKQAQQAIQKAAQAAKAAQKKADQQCPKDPQGRKVWRNPQTNKCELVPQCPQGSTFDSTSRRCLTAAQVKELYGNNNWLIWALIALGVIVVIKK